jgi:hypothetical protein
MADGFEQDAFLWRQQGLSKSAALGTWHAPVRAVKHANGGDSSAAQTVTSPAESPREPFKPSRSD